MSTPGATPNPAPERRTLHPASYMAPAVPGHPYRWLTEVPRPGERARSRLLEVGEVVPPVYVAEGLGLAEDGMAVLRRQVLSIDDEPVELVASYYPVEIARGTAITEFRRIRGGTPTLLAGLGHPPVRSVDRVSARVPTQEENAALRLPGNLPVLHTLRVVYGEGDRPIEVNVMAKAGHLYELQYEFGAG